MNISGKTIEEVLRQQEVDGEAARLSNQLRSRFGDRPVVLCSHLEADEGELTRCVHAGETYVLLCEFCSGRLVESILTEYSARKG